MCTSLCNWFRACTLAVAGHNFMQGFSQGNQHHRVHSRGGSNSQPGSFAAGAFQSSHCQSLAVSRHLAAPVRMCTDSMPCAHALRSSNPGQQKDHKHAALLQPMLCRQVYITRKSASQSVSGHTTQKVMPRTRTCMQACIIIYCSQHISIYSPLSCRQQSRTAGGVADPRAPGP